MTRRTYGRLVARNGLGNDEAGSSTIPWGAGREKLVPRDGFNGHGGW